MVDQLLDEFEQQITRIELVPGSGGVFEVTADGDLVFSKASIGRHAEYEEIAAEIRGRV